jgi:hypothetical protein
LTSVFDWVETLIIDCAASWIDVVAEATDVVVLVLDTVDMTCWPLASID